MRTVLISALVTLALAGAVAAALVPRVRVFIEEEVGWPVVIVSGAGLLLLVAIAVIDRWRQGKRGRSYRVAWASLFLIAALAQAGSGIAMMYFFLGSSDAGGALVGATHGVGWVCSGIVTGLLAIAWLLVEVIDRLGAMSEWRRELEEETNS